MKPIKIIEREMVSKSRSEAECRSLARVRMNMLGGKMNPQRLRGVLLKMGYYETGIGEWEKINKNEVFSALIQQVIREDNSIR